MHSKMYFEVLQSAGLMQNSDQILKVTKLSGGKNSSVKLIELKSNKFVLKQYPAEVKSERLDVEYKFLSWVNKMGINNVPKAITKNFKYNIGVYSYIEGTQIQRATPAGLNACVKFINELNVCNLKSPPEIAHAADCFFSYNELLASIQKRFERLFNFENSQCEEYRAALRYFLQIFEKLTKKNKEFFKELDRYIREMKVIISPSDFGMHNMLQKKNDYFFLDFEYAGYDNALKLICDFACQPRIPIDTQYFEKFVTEINEKITRHNEIFKIVGKFMPIFRLKWSLIILGIVNKNSFKLVSDEDLTRKQIEKSKTYLFKNMGM